MKIDDTVNAALPLYDPDHFNSPIQYYLLDTRTKLTRPTTLMEWARRFQRGDAAVPYPDGLAGWYRVGEDIAGSVRISTVFLGINHSFFPGDPPAIYETCIFDGARSDVVARYSNWWDAHEGHESITSKFVEIRWNRHAEMAAWGLIASGLVAAALGPRYGGLPAALGYCLGWFLSLQLTRYLDRRASRKLE